jgi:hypothetical protein
MMRISKTKYNNQKERQELSEEEDQQYEQERLLIDIMNILKMVKIKLKGSPMNIVKISQINLLQYYWCLAECRKNR